MKKILRFTLIFSVFSTFTQAAPTSEMLLGTNKNGDQIFRDGRILRAGAKEYTKLKTSFKQPTLSNLQGNFAALNEYSSERFYQIIDTVTGERHNIWRCNGGFLALNTERALINDCSGSDESILDMRTGKRLPSDTGAQGVRDGISVEGGVIIPHNYAVYFLEPSGNARKVLDSFSSDKKLIFINNKAFAVRELNKVYLVNIETTEITPFISGVNVMNVEANPQGDSVEIRVTTENLTGEIKEEVFLVD